MAALLRLTLVMTRRSENKKSARSFLVPRPDGIVTRSCRWKVRSGEVKLPGPIPSTILSSSRSVACCCSAPRDSRSTQFIFTASSWTCL